MVRFLIFQWKGIFAACFVGALSFGIVKFPTPTVFFVSIAVWVLCIFFLFHKRLSDRSMWWNIGLMCMSYVSALILISLSEWVVLTRFLIVLASGSIGSFVSIIETEHAYDIPVYTKKAFRRILVMGWVFVCGALLIMTYAISVFFPNIAMWILFLAVGSYSSVISYAVWHMYYPIPIAKFAVWLLIMAVVGVQIFWAIHLLPFGYMVLGFFSTWMWYIALLLIRFHMSVEGVRWKEQRMFLIVNSILFVLVLYIIRWI